MKKILFTANILMVLALASCNNKTEQKAETVPVATEPKKIELKLADLSTNKDFVCGMPLEEGGIADTTSYQGKLYGFCSSECKGEFVKNPSSYLAQK